MDVSKSFGQVGYEEYCRQQASVPFKAWGKLTPQDRAVWDAVARALEKYNNDIRRGIAEEIRKRKLTPDEVDRILSSARKARSIARTSWDVERC